MKKSRDCLDEDSFKLYLTKLDRGIRDMKAASSQIEKENELMEMKLKSLKLVLEKEKEERETMSGPRWRSSKSPPKKLLPKLPATKTKKVKVLADKPLDYYQKNTTVKAKKCGQCQTNACLVCYECRELFCSLCFKTVHSRGNLKKHYAKKVNVDMCPRKTSLTSSAPSLRSPPKKSVQISTITIGTDTPLMEGEYSETKGAFSFAQALKEWRDGRSSAPPVVSLGCACTQTDHQSSSQQKSVLNIHFTPSLSYLDRITLRRHKTVAPNSDLHIETEDSPLHRTVAPNSDLHIQTEDSPLHRSQSAPITRPQDPVDTCFQHVLTIEEVFEDEETASRDASLTDSYVDKDDVVSDGLEDDRVARSREITQNNMNVCWTPAVVYKGLEDFYLIAVDEVGEQPVQSPEKIDKFDSLLSVKEGSVWIPESSVQELGCRFIPPTTEDIDAFVQSSHDQANSLT